MIVTGMRPFTRISVVGQRIEGTDGTATLATFQLLNFKTKRANGSYTLLGRLLERLEFNRLPELWNVIVGDMNLVGVKPLPAGDTAQLTEEWQQKHHDGRTGFTGLWYLQTNASSDLDAILIADVYYTATRTWNGDMLILLRTPLQWIRRCIQLDGHSKSDSELLVHADNVRST
jgi:lipopolysaccharide/colanic/teichoic acid biosynthesis glycosyltransferase